MNIQQAYNIWSRQYDTDSNKTRDLEGLALQKTLTGIHVEHCLEIGCGTGKNTQWLTNIARRILAVDLSDEMLAVAKGKIQSEKVRFVQADIMYDWAFAKGEYDLVTFSLVLEHIENLDFVFEQLNKVTPKDGYVYIGELHPFKQYSGSKARFDTEEGRQVLTCFNHHVSDFTNAAWRHGFGILDINEHFDDKDKTSIPRILTLLFKKK